MSPRILTHGTLVMERTYKATPKRVFAAWESVDARQRWQTPTPEVRLEYVEADFRQGGREVVRCFQTAQPIWEAQVHYLDIRRDSLIVFTELVSGEGVHESAALVGVEFTPVPDGTHLMVTLQIAAFNGETMLGGYQFGWNAALDNLAKEL
ncbi:MAG: SRPBCC domain-containing protein [Vitreimonas sp.]